MQRKTKRRLITGVAAAAGLFALLLASPWIYAIGAGMLWDRAEREIHLLPTGFTGPVVILLNDSAATPSVREHRPRLFRIPASGALHSRFGVNTGWGRPDYFYVDSQDRRTQLHSGTPCERALAGDPVQACLLGHTTFGDLPDREYEAYVVGRRADQRKWAWSAERFVDSVVYGRSIP